MWLKCNHYRPDDDFFFCNNKLWYSHWSSMTVQVRLEWIQNWRFGKNDQYVYHWRKIWLLLSCSMINCQIRRKIKHWGFVGTGISKYPFSSLDKFKIMYAALWLIECLPTCILQTKPKLELVSWLIFSVQATIPLTEIWIPLKTIIFVKTVSVYSTYLLHCVTYEWNYDSCSQHAYTFYLESFWGTL